MRFDFPTIMVLLVLISGGIWALDALVFAPRRRLAATRAGQGVGGGASDDERAAVVPGPPKIVEYARSFFPVFLIVFAVRSFVVEPFRIPSGSMIPTLLIGDFILVNKFAYGIRLPVLDQKILETGAPERGDVVVFRYPEDPSTPFIKRVVGLPGDRIGYYDKVLYINGKPAQQERLGPYVSAQHSSNMSSASERIEHLGSMEHEILVQPGYPSLLEGETVVPDGHYFVLGDNRDNSRDSRYWGTVPDDLLIGKAFLIWMNWDWKTGVAWQRIGTIIQ